MGHYPTYPAYKPSNVSWLGEIPRHWDVWKVTHGFNRIGSGTTPRSDNPLFYDGDIPWVTTSELRESIILYTAQKVTQEAVMSHSALKLYPKGSLAIAMYGATIGRLGMLGVPATFNQACCVFAEPTVFDMRFVYYWLWMRRPILISLSSGGGQPNLSQDDLKKSWIPIPCIEEQRTIARFLDFKTAQIDALIAKKGTLLDKLVEKRTALISHAVTMGLDPSVPMKDSGVTWLGVVPAHWKVIPIKFSLAMPITDGPHSTPQFFEDGVPFLSAESVKNDRLDFSRMRGFISEDDHAIYSKKYKPKFGDVYMVKSGATTGAVAKVETYDEFNIWSPLAVLRPHPEKLITDYLFYVLKSKPFFYSVELSWSYGTQQNIGMGVISNIRMALPPLEEQRKICRHLEPLLQEIEAQKAAVDSVVERLREYRSALISQAITGKIDVRGFQIPQPVVRLAS